MRTGSYRLLLVQDPAGDGHVLRRTLADAAPQFAVVSVPGCAEAAERMHGEEYDVVLIDADRKPRDDESLAAVLQYAGAASTVLVAGADADPLRRRAQRLGIRECLPREHLDRSTLLHALTAAAQCRIAERALVESESRYRRLLESVTDYVYMVQVENGRPASSWHSPSCVTVTGYTSEEYAQNPSLWYQMVHEEDRRAVLDMAEDVCAGRVPPPLEHRILHKDGSIRWIRNTPVPRRDPDGRLAGYDGLVSDITARKRAEQELLRVNQALREREEQLKRELENSKRAKKEWEVTFDAISSPLFLHDRDYRIIRANVAYRDAAGMPFEELLGRPYYTVFPKRDGPLDTCTAAMTTQDDRGTSAEEEIEVPAMNKIFRSRPYPVRDGDVYFCSVHVLEDITAMKRAEEHIIQEMEVTANLLMIAKTAAYTTDRDKLMEKTASCGAMVMECDAFAAYLWDQERKAFLPSRHYGLEHEWIPLFRTEPLDVRAEFVRLLLERRASVVVRFPGENGRGPAAATPFPEAKAAQTVSTTTPAWTNGEMRTVLAIPLIGKTDVLGLLLAAYRDERTFAERDRKIVEGLSRQISLALDDARLYRTALERSLELNNKIETLQVMYEIDRSILSTLEPHEVLETATSNICRIVPCDGASILLADRERQGFIHAAGHGRSGASAPFVPFRDTSATEVLRSGRPQFEENRTGAADLAAYERQLLAEGFFSHIRIPLVVKGEAVGVLGVKSKRAAAFTPENVSTLERVANQIGVALENTRLVTDLQELLLGTVKSLSHAIDAKSPWTAGHSERVTRYAVAIGRRMGIPDREIKDLELGSLLHDVGKIAIHDVILNKPCGLTREEFEIVKRHPVRGVELLEPIKQFNRVIPCIRHHHERFDGTGYPDGLRGEQIPLWARILSVADAYDSMTVERPYRMAFAREAAIAELNRCAATQFDPAIVAAFIGWLSGSIVSSHGTMQADNPPQRFAA